MKSLALALALLATPAFARSRPAASKAPAATKAPRAGSFCGKSASGTTQQDAKGASLECKADKKGKLRWTKK